MTTSPVVLTSPETGQALHVSRRTIHRWVKSGRIRPLRKANEGGGGYLFTAEEVARVAALPRSRRGRRPAQ